VGIAAVGAHTSACRAAKQRQKDILLHSCFGAPWHYSAAEAQK